jgi:hypothetical protein
VFSSIFACCLPCLLSLLDWLCFNHASKPAYFPIWMITGRALVGLQLLSETESMRTNTHAMQ